MDSRGECCIARYTGGGAYDMSKVDRIMLRFRPIAPKPATGSSGSPLEKTESNSKSVKGKRKHTKNNSKKCNRKRKISNEENRDAVVTLNLLPEIPDRKDLFPVDKVAPGNVSTWLGFGNRDSDRTVVMMPPPRQAVKVTESCVTVECVTDTWMDGDGLGINDEERRVNLEKDTCPGFISDNYGRVTWTNEAYRKMVGKDDDYGYDVDDDDDNDVMVWLMMKEEVKVTVRMLTYPAFTCWVRLQYTCGKEKSSLILPCDVWRMERGGFAWRLDVKAALCLGR